MEVGVRANRRRDGCGPVGWEGYVGRESITLFLVIFGSKMVVVVVMVEMVVFGHKYKHASWFGGFCLSVWRRRGVHPLEVSEVRFKIAPVRNGVVVGGSPGEFKTLPLWHNFLRFASYISSSHQVVSSPGVGEEMCILRNGDLEERRTETFYSPS